MALSSREVAAAPTAISSRKVATVMTVLVAAVATAFESSRSRLRSRRPRGRRGRESLTCREGTGARLRKRLLRIAGNHGASGGASYGSEGIARDRGATENALAVDRRGTGHGSKRVGDRSGRMFPKTGT